MEIITFAGEKTSKVQQQKINFHDAADFRPKEKPLPDSRLCLSPLSINMVVLENKLKNVDIIEGPVEKIGANGKMISVYFRDPDGNLIEISNYVKNS
jgi:catechol 2,3-dioxygenase-like lactoylglutathione lyase family enzyme